MECSSCKFFKGYLRKEFHYAKCAAGGTVEKRILDHHDQPLVCPVEEKNYPLRPEQKMDWRPNGF